MVPTSSTSTEVSSVAVAAVAGCQQSVVVAVVAATEDAAGTDPLGHSDQRLQC